MPNILLHTVVSGGQSGVDRAALDAALACGLACGGWCPRGRRAEDGRIPARYPLRETPSRRYLQRTEWNVRDSDATLIIAPPGPLGGGTRRTLDFARSYGRPHLVVIPEVCEAVRVREWLAAGRIGILNVAGPRESQSPGIHRAALCLLTAALLPAPRDSD